MPDLLEKIQSMPGIGFKSAFCIISEIWDIRRFDTMDQLKSYAGLIPSTHSSGESIKESNLTNRRNTFLRTTLVECAWIAIRNDTVLMDYYAQLSNRMKGQQAITRIAKKLLTRLRRVWLGDELYVKGLYV
jgi:transposase